MTTPEQATDFVHAAVPAIGRFGLQVTAIEPGRVALSMPFEGNGNHMGTMYAGALFAIAELPGGLLPLSVLEGQVVPILKQLTIRFARPARGTVTLEAAIDPGRLRELAAQALADGRAEFDLELQVTDAEGEVVAISHGTYQLRPAAGVSSGAARATIATSESP